MSDTLLVSEPTLRLAAFIGVLVAMVAWEPWWDRLLGAYVDQPPKGHDGMEIGIEQFRTPRDLWLDRMLIQPARGPASGHALDARIATKEPAE